MKRFTPSARLADLNPRSHFPETVRGHYRLLLRFGLRADTRLSVVEVDGGGGEGDLGAVGGDDLLDAQQHVLFDLVEFGPDRGVGEAVDEG
jgi:hypothetical protein